jgi:hypothetical protein
MDVILQDRLRQLVSSRLGVDLDELVEDARFWRTWGPIPDVSSW